MSKNFTFGPLVGGQILEPLQSRFLVLIAIDVVNWLVKKELAGGSRPSQP